MHDAGFLIQRFEQLRSNRSTQWDSHWQEIADLIWPDQADFTDPNRVPGEKRSNQLYDATAALALDRFAAAMESLLTPRSQKWHHLRASVKELNDDPEVKDWFDDVTTMLFRMRERPRTNYYGSAHEGYKSDGAFGTSLLWLDEDKGDAKRNIRPGGFRYRSDPLSSCYIASNANGEIDTCFRRYTMSAHAAQMRWREHPLLPEVIRSSKNPFEEHEFLLCVMPREDAIPGRMDDEGKPYVAYELSVQGQVILEEGGYWEFPWVVGRYTRNAGEVYGRSPAMLILPDVKTLQEQEKTFLRAGHRAVDPPLLLTHDGVVSAGGSRAPRIQPGGLNFGGLNERGEPMIKPLMTGMRLDLTEAMMEQKRRSINDAFLVTLFQILVEEPRQMTATEVLERAQEKGQLIAPLIGRQQSEKLGPQIEREINILSRQGLLPQMPQALIEAEGEYEIEYDSPATRFQRMEEISGLTRTIEAWAPILEQQPDLMRLAFKPLKGIRETAALLGVPGGWLNSDEEQAAIQEEMAAAAQAVQEQEAMADQARAARDTVEAVGAAQQLAG